MASSVFWTNKITANGEPLTVTRGAKLGSSAKSASAAVSAVITMMPQPIGPDQATRFGLEGGTNYMEEQPHAFYCAASTVLGPGMPIASGDNIAYNGAIWKILTVIPFRVRGVTLCLICVANLKGPS